jgi:hypothetical protein
MNIILVALAIVIFALIFVEPRPCLTQRGGTVMGPFQTLTEKEMDGVPDSWSGRPNPSNPSRPIYVADRNPITYYGHNIPPIPVEPGPLLHPMNIAPNSGLAVLPECCPSPYSTDRGCLCGAMEDLRI